MQTFNDSKLLNIVNEFKDEMSDNESVVLTPKGFAKLFVQICKESRNLEISFDFLSSYYDRMDFHYLKEQDESLYEIITDINIKELTLQEYIKHIFSCYFETELEFKTFKEFDKLLLKVLNSLKNDWTYSKKLFSYNINSVVYNGFLALINGNEPSSRDKYILRLVELFYIKFDLANLNFYLHKEFENFQYENELKISNKYLNKYAMKDSDLTDEQVKSIFSIYKDYINNFESISKDFEYMQQLDLMKLDIIVKFGLSNDYNIITEELSKSSIVELLSRNETLLQSDDDIWMRLFVNYYNDIKDMYIESVNNILYILNQNYITETDIAESLEILDLSEYKDRLYNVLEETNLIFQKFYVNDEYQSMSTTSMGKVLKGLYLEISEMEKNMTDRARKLISQEDLLDAEDICVAVSIICDCLSELLYKHDICTFDLFSFDKISMGLKYEKHIEDLNKELIEEYSIIDTKYNFLEYSKDSLKEIVELKLYKISNSAYYKDKFNRLSSD